MAQIDAYLEHSFNLYGPELTLPGLVQSTEPIESTPPRIQVYSSIDDIYALSATLEGYQELALRPSVVRIEASRPAGPMD